MYDLHRFGCDALAFVRYQISAGPTLGIELCDLPIEWGKVFAFLPPYRTHDQLLHFIWHTNTRFDLEYQLLDWEYRDKQTELIATYLESPSDHVAFLYNRTWPLATKPPAFSPSVGQTCRHHPPNKTPDQVIVENYLALRSPSRKEDVSRLSQYDLGSSCLIGVLAALPDGLPLTDESNEISKEGLREIAARTDYILVPAYGDDAVLIWSRSGSLPIE